ncbi:hypothetical protein F5884DRAFT_770309 [Xylogone sp. PMI_703]|nr:hypothetical protein F5884DRAFT_770309 [Xylogone sp. PMI_703]
MVVHIQRPNLDSSAQSIGICTGILLKRDIITPMFHSMVATAYYETRMEHELFNLIFTLFDRFGRFRTVFQEHPVKRGSGIWREELDNGNIVILDSMFVLSDGTSKDELIIEIVNWFIERARDKSGNILIVQPTKSCFDWMEDVFANGITISGTWISRPTDPEWPAASFFFTLMGFRRIGNTDYFGLPLTFLCGSFGVSIADDYPQTPLCIGPPRLPQFENLQRGIALHPDTTITQKLRRFRFYTSANHSDWFVGDKNGNTILHSAAIFMKPQAVRWILNNFGRCLIRKRNHRGETPLEAILSKLENTRERYDITYHVDQPLRFLSDHWSGCSDSSAQCIALLLGIKSPNHNDFSRIQYGCTCGECIEGFLSPRACAAIEYAADTALDELIHNINEPQAWIESNYDYFIDFPEKFQFGVTKLQVRRGLIYLWECIRDCVVKHKYPPSELNIRASLKARYNWPLSILKSGPRRSECESIVHYLRCGRNNGHDTMKAATVMIFKKAMNSDELTGDSSFIQNYKGFYSSLPRCRNDHEFSYVSTHCGFKHAYIPHSMKSAADTLKEHSFEIFP